MIIYKRPSVFKFYELLNSNDKKEICNFAMYLKEAFKHRNNINNGSTIMSHANCILLGPLHHVY
jgi:hypothetical protein